MPVVSRTRATLRSAEFGFFGRVREHARADAAALGRALQRGRLRLLGLRLPSLADELGDRGHSDSWLRTRRSNVRAFGIGRGWTAADEAPEPTGQDTRRLRAASTVTRRWRLAVRARRRSSPAVGALGVVAVAGAGHGSDARSTVVGSATRRGRRMPRSAAVAGRAASDARAATSARSISSSSSRRVEGQRLVVGRLGLDVAVARHAGPGRDELADDHVLLEAHRGRRCCPRSPPR